MKKKRSLINNLIDISKKWYNNELNVQGQYLISTKVSIDPLISLQVFSSRFYIVFYLQPKSPQPGIMYLASLRQASISPITILILG